MDVNNYESFTESEYKDNLDRLGVRTHESLMGKSVYYSKMSYGVHIVIEWDPDRAEFLLDLEGQKFWSNPFRITLV